MIKAKLYLTNAIVYSVWCPCHSLSSNGLRNTFSRSNTLFGFSSSPSSSFLFASLFLSMNGWYNDTTKLIALREKSQILNLKLLTVFDATLAGRQPVHRRFVRPHRLVKAADRGLEVADLGRGTQQFQLNRIVRVLALLGCVLAFASL